MSAGPSPPATGSRLGPATRWVLLGLGAALVLLPLGLRRPGVPLGLRADEPSHYLLARSLAHDGDARVDARDLDRYFREFPYSDPIRLELAWDGLEDDSAEGYAAAPRFAVDPVYALALVPWVAAGRADAAFAFNALCFVLALALVGRHFLGRGRDPGLAWTLAGGALFLSAAFVYVGWIHPASLRLFLVAAAFGLGWRATSAATTSAPGRRLPVSLAAAAAGLCLGLAAGEVPWLAALVPAFLLRGRPGSKLLGLGTGLILALGASWMVLGHATSPSFAEPAAFVAHTPDDVPTPAAGLDAAPEGLLPPSGAATTVRRLVLAFVDARRGLLPLFPFALLFLCPIVDRLRGRQTDFGLDRRLLLVGVAAIVLSRPFVLPDGADLARFGDPTLVAAWPALLFLLPTVRLAGRGGALAVLATGFVSALLLLPSILTPFLPPVPSGDAHHATRGGLLSVLPTGLEEVSEAGGFEPTELGGSDELRLWLPPWTHERRGERFAFLGGIVADGWLELERPPDVVPPDELHLLLRNFAPDNRVWLHLGEKEVERLFPGQDVPESTRVSLPLGNELRPAKRRDGTAVWVAPFRVRTSTGEKPFWRTPIHEDHYTGLEVAFLGSDVHLDRDVFAVDWLGCGAPTRLQPGESFRALVRLRNTSAATWHADGAARVRLGHRWRSDGSTNDGSSMDGARIESPSRAELPHDTAPGEVVLAWVDAEAPAEPGSWTLEIEPIYEWVAWFSDRTDGAICAVAVEVAQAA